MKNTIKAKKVDHKMTIPSTPLADVVAYHAQLSKRSEVHELHRALSSFLHMDRHCTNCEYFNHTHETCSKANDQRPPAQVIVNSCVLWEMDIPF